MRRLTVDRTPKQGRVQELIAAWLQERGYLPTFQELALRDSESDRWSARCRRHR
jgi:hypothetical protein